MRLNDYFDAIFCINLDRRTDRWEASKAIFDKHKMDVIRISAVDGSALADGHITRNELGCSLSHANVLERMVNENMNKILVLEDDVDFIEDLQGYFAAHVNSIPVNWNMLYFGGNHINPPVKVNSAIAKINRTYTTSSYAINRNTARAAIADIRAGRKQVDVVYSRYHPGSMCYAFVPAIAWQRTDYSDIQGGVVDYTPHMR